MTVRVVARFVDPPAAGAAYRELADLFEAFRVDRPAAEAIAARRGLAWPDVEAWATEMLREGPPAMATEHDVVVLYGRHGFAPVLSWLLGAKPVEEDRRAPTVSALFAAAKVRPALEGELAALFAQIDARRHETQPLATPWGGLWSARGPGAYFRDTASIGFHVALDPRDMASLRAWLFRGGVDAPVLRLCDDTDAARFAAIAAARCQSCEGPVEYLDPRLHDIESAQLVCRRCGGLYELAAFLRPSASGPRSR